MVINHPTGGKIVQSDDPNPATPPTDQLSQFTFDEAPTNIMHLSRNASGRSHINPTRATTATTTRAPSSPSARLQLLQQPPPKELLQSTLFKAPINFRKSLTEHGHGHPGDNVYTRAMKKLGAFEEAYLRRYEPLTRWQLIDQLYEAARRADDVAMKKVAQVLQMKRINSIQQLAAFAGRSYLVSGSTIAVESDSNDSESSESTSDDEHARQQGQGQKEADTAPSLSECDRREKRFQRRLARAERKVRAQAEARDRLMQKLEMQLESDLDDDDDDDDDDEEHEEHEEQKHYDAEASTATNDNNPHPHPPPPMVMSTPMRSRALRAQVRLWRQLGIDATLHTPFSNEEEPNNDPIRFFDTLPRATNNVEEKQDKGKGKGKASGNGTATGTGASTAGAMVDELDLDVEMKLYEARAKHLAQSLDLPVSFLTMGKIDGDDGDDGGGFDANSHSTTQRPIPLSLLQLELKNMRRREVQRRLRELAEEALQEFPSASARRVAKRGAKAEAEEEEGNESGTEEKQQLDEQTMEVPHLISTSGEAEAPNENAIFSLDDGRGDSDSSTAELEVDRVEGKQMNRNPEHVASARPNDDRGEGNALHTLDEEDGAIEQDSNNTHGATNDEKSMTDSATGTTTAATEKAYRAKIRSSVARNKRHTKLKTNTATAQAVMHSIEPAEATPSRRRDADGGRAGRLNRSLRHSSMPQTEICHENLPFHHSGHSPAWVNEEGRIDVFDRLSRSPTYSGHHPSIDWQKEEEMKMQIAHPLSDLSPRPPTATAAAYFSRPRDDHQRPFSAAAPYSKPDEPIPPSLDASYRVPTLALGKVRRADAASSSQSARPVAAQPAPTMTAMSAPQPVSFDTVPRSPFRSYSMSLTSRPSSSISTFIPGSSPSRTDRAARVQASLSARWSAGLSRVLASEQPFNDRRRMHQHELGRNIGRMTKLHAAAGSTMSETHRTNPLARSQQLLQHKQARSARQQRIEELKREIRGK